MTLRRKIAAAAARIIAEDGATYAAAKERAAGALGADTNRMREILPNNAEIENELKRYLALFGNASHAERLASLRKTAVSFMELAAPFGPYLTGAVLSGTATDASDIHIHCFTDDAKAFLFFLDDEGIRYTCGESPLFSAKNRIFETVSLGFGTETIHVTLFSTDDIRRPASFFGPHANRAPAAAVRGLLENE